MSVPNNEEVVPDNTGQAPNDQQQDDQQQVNGHPAWDEILNVVPDEFHEMLKPTLKKWDDGVQEKFQQIHQQYDPYKPLVENNIPLDEVQQALYLAHQLNTNPAELVQQAIDHFNLEQFKQAQSQQQQNLNDPDDPDGSEDFSLDDLEDDPRYKALLEKQREIESKITKREQEEQEQEAEQALEQYLGELREAHGEFDENYVVTLLANGVDGEAAVKQFQNTVSQAAQALIQQQQEQNPPRQTAVIAGSGGTSGSGVPDQPLKFGEMKDGQVSDLVAEYIKNAQAG